MSTGKSCKSYMTLNEIKKKSMMSNPGIDGKNMLLLCGVALGCRGRAQVVQTVCEETFECIHALHEGEQGKGDARVHPEGISSHQPDTGQKGQ